MTLTARLNRLLQTLPKTYQGPGGAIAILQRGEILARHAWGFANMERRIPFTPATLHRMCSITKQFTCATMLATFPDPTILDPDVQARLPTLQQPAPTALQLAHNQSGLRDYWAVAMLHGAPPESDFGDTEAALLIGATRTLHFQPGTRYSYVNQNFRLLSDIIQHRTGRPFAELLRKHVFNPAGMPTAILAADTRAMPDGTEGYEGNQATGFRPAINRILWTGDAGLGASLDDMIAWERHIDATRDDPAALYPRLSAPITFADNTPATYGFGLSRRPELGHPATSHGGALRGWRSHRMYLPNERISVVVLFNHMADAHGAAIDALAALLDADRPPPTLSPNPPLYLGAYIEPETGLSVRLAHSEGRLRLKYGTYWEPLDINDDGTAGTQGTRLRPGEDGLWMDIPQDHQSTRLQPLDPTPGALDVAGRYRCEELGAELTIANAGGVLHAAFSGFLGRGRMEILDPIGKDVWALPCPRALDHTPPGDWTLAIKRDPTGTPTHLQLGCWLARNLTYTRLDT
jgi:D-aminopeptidase